MMRFFSLLLGWTLAGAVFAQDTYYPPVRVESGVRAVTESSSKWQPQIQPTYRWGAPRPSNPTRQHVPLQESNSLPVGSILEGISRGTKQARFPGIDATGWSPPDPNIAVGPNHVVEVVNSDIAWFDKASGAKQFQVSMGPISGPAEGFFESLGATSFVFDPKCHYDQISGRYYVLALEVEDSTETSKLLIAVSDDNNPNGNWHKYRIEAKMTVGGNTYWLDYPGFGFNKDAIVVTGNMFRFSGSGVVTQAIVIPKAPLQNGQTASATSFQISSFSVQVCTTYDASLDRIYMIGEGPSTTSMTLFAVTNPGSSPAIVSTNVSVPGYLNPTTLAGSVNGHNFDPLDGRMLEAAWRNGRLVATHGVRVSSSNNRNMVRWYEISTNNYPSGTPMLFQSGNVQGSANEDYIMPGISLNSQGDIAIVFTRCSGSIVADIMMAGRKASDPTGSMGTPILIKSSLGATYGNPGFNRWGDYFDVEVDPSDDLSFWSVGMMGKANGNWTTEITKITISTIVPIFVDYDATSLAIYTDGASNPPVQGFDLVGGPVQVAASDDVYATLKSVLSPGAGQIAAYESSYATVTSNGTPKAISVKVELKSSVNVTAMVWLYDYTAGKYVQMKAFNVGTGADTVQTVNALAPFTRYIGPGGAAKVVVRGLNPMRRRQIPSPFMLSLDDVELKVRY
jgi:hypothetical protein